MFIQALDILRIIVVVLAFGFAYSNGVATTPEQAAAQIHLIMPWYIIGIALTTGIEGFFPEQTAKAKGFVADPSYRYQTSVFFLSYAAMAAWVYFGDWGTVAETTLVVAFTMMLVFSALNHLYATISRKNFAWQNINRPIFTAALVYGLYQPVMLVIGSL